MGFIRNFNIEIVDGLDSTSPDSALSSNQGKILDTKITKVSTEVNNAINGVNEKVDNFVQRVDTECVKSRDTIIGEEITIDNRDLHTIVGKLEEDLNDVKPRLEQAESKNIDQDIRLKEVENKNKVQDVYLSGLFNENKDGRLSIEGEGNYLKLEGSKEGLVEVDSIVGNTLVNNVVKLTPPTMSDNASFEKIERTEYENYIEYKLINALDTTTGAIIDWLAKVQYPLKDNNVYTLVVPNTPQTSDFSYYNIHSNGVSYRTQDTSSVFVFTPINWNSDGYFYFYCFMNTYNIGDTITVRFPKHIMILEGDHTDKSIPREHFEGLQSSFEENLVTQDMIDKGLEDVENLGKYKVPIKLVGKNKLNTSLLSIHTSTTYGGFVYPTETRLMLSVTDKDTSIDMSGIYFGFSKDGTGSNARWLINNGVTLSTKQLNNYTRTGDLYNISFYPKTQDTVDKLNARFNIQLEEGTVATDYEEYFERTTNVYLNSPLLEGDEIVMHNGELCHYHKRNKVVLDGNNDKEMQFATAWSSIADIFIFTSSNVSDMACDNKNTNYLIADNVITDTYNQFVVYKNGVDKLTSQKSTSGKRLLWSLPKDKYTLASFKQKLQNNPTTVIYELAEPYYEPIQTDSLILESINDATIHIDTVVPIQTINASYTSNIPSLTSMTKNIETLEDTNIDILATTWDTDYRVCEIEWTLESLIDSSTSISLTDNLRTRGVVTMALTRFEQAKIIINGDAYYRPIFQKQLERYLEKGYLTQEEFDILIAMMDEREKEKQ